MYTGDCTYDIELLLRIVNGAHTICHVWHLADTHNRKILNQKRHARKNDLTWSVTSQRVTMDHFE